MSKNTGKAFEKLTQEIYQAFCDFDTNKSGFQKLQVMHNVKIKGKSGVSHQIDVFWEFNLAGVNYKTLVEVKDWQSPVEKEQILSLKSKIDDIPNSNGIFVSRSGFQEGAKAFAEYGGIQLITITEDSDFKIALNFITTNYENLKVIFALEDLYKLPISVDYLKKSMYEEELENLIVLKPDKYTEKIFDLMCIDAEPYYYGKDNVRHHIKKDLEGDWYLMSNKASFPLVKIYGYSFNCYNTSKTYIWTIKDLPMISINNILEGNKRHYNKDTKSIIDFCHLRVNI